jgi:Galactose oxidase-like, Early set domain/Kelch motif
VRSASGTFRTLTGADLNDISPNYPRNFIAPDGRVFGYGSSKSGAKMYYVDTNASGSLELAGRLPFKLIAYSPAAMFRSGRILQLDPDSNQAIVIDFNSDPPKWTYTNPLSSARLWSNSTILPDGKVLITGGESRFNGDGAEEERFAVNYVEIWDPETGEWKQGASGARARLYHSTALLLPDASVLVAGGGAKPGAPLNNLNAEIFYPPFLFNSSGDLADRPKIESIPRSLKHGQHFSLPVSGLSGPARVTMIKTGAVTHSNNMEQRFFELKSSFNENHLEVDAPSSVNFATPGFYLIFVIDAKGVPSIGEIVKLVTP